MRAAAIVLLLLLGACAGPRPPRGEACSQREIGLASWYGPGFQGERTASGESFDQKEFSAAHRDYPLPSRARVTNLANGRHINVRINDRGPFAQNRLIDLSHAAARALDAVESGETRVEVCYLGPDSRGSASK